MKKLLSLVIAIGITLTLFPSNLVKADGEYKITIDPRIKNALIRTDYESYNAGENVSGNYKTKDGYYIGEIYFNGNPVGLDINSNGKFSFVMPSKNVFITADIIKEYNKYEEATGIFGVEYTKMINNIATILDLSPKDLESSLNNWLSKSYKTDQDIVVTRKEGGTDDFATNVAINFLVLNLELKNDGIYINEENKAMDVKKCLLNSDVVFKLYVTMYEYVKHNSNSAINEYDDITESLKGPLVAEIKKCEALRSNDEVCPVTLLRKELTEAKEQPGKPDAPTSNYDVLKSNLTYLYNMTVPKTSEEIDKIIDNSLNILAEKGDDIMENIKYLIDNPDILYVLVSIPISRTAINNYSLLNCYLTDRLYSSDFYLSYLNSDVVFKAMAQIIDACQTGDQTTVLTTLLSLYGPIKNEDINIYRNEYGKFDEDYIKFLIKRSFTKHKVINHTPKEYGSLSNGYIEIIDNPINDNESMIMNTSLVKIKAVPASSDLLTVVCYVDSNGIHYVSLDSDGYGQFIMPNEDVNLYGIFNKNEPTKKDESCEKVIGPTWHWNNTKGVCEEVGVVGTSTR